MHLPRIIEIIFQEIHSMHSTALRTAHCSERREKRHKKSWKKHLHSVGSSSSLVFVLLIWINVIAARCILVSCFSCCFIHCIVIHGYNRVRWIPLSEYAPQRQRLIFNNLLLFRCVRECALCMCVFVCCRFVVVAVFFICRWKSTFILRIILICWIFPIYVFCFLHHCRLFHTFNPTKITALLLYDPQAILSSLLFGIKMNWSFVVSTFFIFCLCFFRSRIFHLKTIQPERLCVTLLCSFIKRNRVWWRGIFNEKNEPTKRRFSAHKHFQNPHNRWKIVPFMSDSRNLPQCWMYVMILL